MAFTPRRDNRPPREPPIIAGKVPPHDLDAEAAVLSAILLKQDTLDQVAEILKSEHFYSEANGKIYEAAVELARMSQPIDTVQVASWLRDRERLAQIGGPAYLAQIVDATPAVAHVQAHARTVREKWRLRRLIAECQRVSAEGYGDVGGVQEFIDGAEQAIYELARTPEASSAQPISQVLRAAFEQISKAAERGDRITGISTGFAKMDEKTAGLHNGDLMIIAARPGMGKTSFVLNLAVNVASPRNISMPGPQDRGYGSNERKEPGFGVAVFSLEMPREQLATRMVCSEARVDVGKLRGGHLTAEDWRRLTEAASYLTMLPVWLDDTPAIGLLELRAKVRRMQAEYNRPETAESSERRMGLVVIDYLQLMSGRPNAQSREQEISEISRGLKQLAKELRVPVIALSQLNRAVETRAGKDKRPQLSDLRECVTGETLVVLADGRRVPIRELVGSTPTVLAVEDGKVIEATSDKVWSVGRRPVFKVTLESGRFVRATAKHRLLTASGWKRVAKMDPQDRIAVARWLSAAPASRVTAANGNCSSTSMTHIGRVVTTSHEAAPLALASGDVRQSTAASFDASFGQDLLWDRVVSIEPDGEEEVFDLTVPGPASWLADGIVSHNSGAIEQDADTICFIYRDEYYNPETTEHKGVAELIIAKQRNGPTGKVFTRFTSSCTRFDNLQPGDYPDFEDD